MSQRTDSGEHRIRRDPKLLRLAGCDWKRGSIRLCASSSGTKTVGWRRCAGVQWTEVVSVGAQSIDDGFRAEDVRGSPGDGGSLITSSGWRGEERESGRVEGGGWRWARRVGGWRLVCCRLSSSRSSSSPVAAGTSGMRRERLGRREGGGEEGGGRSRWDERKEERRRRSAGCYGGDKGRETTSEVVCYQDMAER